MVALVVVMGCGAGAEVGETCDTTADCANEEPDAPHSGECRRLTCVDAACSYADNAGDSCNGGTCNGSGECVLDD